MKDIRRNEEVNDNSNNDYYFEIKKKSLNITEHAFFFNFLLKYVSLPSVCCNTL